jgi:hypothetical protein
LTPHRPGYIVTRVSERRGLVRAGDLVRAYLGDGDVKRRGHRVLRVFEAFRSLGPPLTRRAEPVWYGRGILHLRVFGSAWMTELSFMTDEIAARLNEKLGQPWVESVRLRAGPPAPWGDDRRVGPKLSPSQLERVEALGAAVSRPEVRAAVMRAAAAHLGRPPDAKPRAPLRFQRRYPWSGRS